MTLPCPPGCASSIAVYTLESLFWPVFAYIISQRSQELCIVLMIAMYMPRRSRWTTTELQMVPIRDTNGHTQATTLAMYILLHTVHFGPVLKYRLFLSYRVSVTVPVAEILKAPG